MEEVNRKNVNRIKRMIIGTVLFLMVLPMVLCVLLFVRLGRLEKKVDQLTEERNAAEVLLPQETDTAKETQVQPELDDYVVETETNQNDRLMAGRQEEGTAGDAAIKENAVNKVRNSENSDEAEEEKTDENRNKNGKVVYLTFDDGPSCYTDEILNILAEKNVKATFFVVMGDQTYADALQRIADEGHTIGVHSMSHVYSDIYKDLDSFKADVKGLHDLILDITGIDTHYYRFPGGSSNEVSRVPIDECIAWLDGAGYTYYDWNAMNGDATAVDYTPEQLKENVLSYVHAAEGDSMVLMHDLGAHYATVQALPSLIDTLLEEGYTLAPIDDEAPAFHQHEISQQGE